MAKDFYLKATRKQHQALQSARAQALAELEAHKASGDSFSAGQTVQQLADIAASEQNLQALVNQYAASQTPQAPPEQSPEERHAKPIERMDWRDIVEMTRQSKYAKDIQPNDPGLIAGYNEAMRRRARGE